MLSELALELTQQCGLGRKFEGRPVFGLVDRRSMYGLRPSIGLCVDDNLRTHDLERKPDPIVDALAGSLN
jgi:hypothetical protein